MILIDLSIISRGYPKSWLLAGPSVIESVVFFVLKLVQILMVIRLEAVMYLWLY